MQKYEVTKAWHGVAVGQIVEMGCLHPALAAHVRPIHDDAPQGTLTPATPAAATPEPAAPRRGRPPKQQE